MCYHRASGASCVNKRHLTLCFYEILNKVHSGVDDLFTESFLKGATYYERALGSLSKLTVPGAWELE